jgi:ATP-dependent Clp protease adapter protein ClpS
MTAAFDAYYGLDARRAAGASSAEPDVDVLVEEDVEDEADERLDEPWKVILYNDAIHSFDEVILQLIKATGCSTGEAVRIAWKAHMTGKALAFTGTFDECFRVNGVLREIQLVTEIEG